MSCRPTTRHLVGVAFGTLAGAGVFLVRTVSASSSGSGRSARWRKDDFDSDAVDYNCSFGKDATAECVRLCKIFSTAISFIKLDIAEEVPYPSERGLTSRPDLSGAIRANPAQSI